MAAYSPFRLLGAFFLYTMLLNLHFTLSMPIRRDCASLVSRQTTTIASLISQDTLCIPTTVNTTELMNTVAGLASTASSGSSVRPMGFGGTFFGKIIKGAWNVLKPVLEKVVIDGIVDWLGVGEWLDLILKGWKLLTSPDHTTIIATSPDGATTKQFIVKKPPKVIKPPKDDCGGTTRKMCPRSTLLLL